VVTSLVTWLVDLATLNTMFINKSNILNHLV